MNRVVEGCEGEGVRSRTIQLSRPMEWVACLFVLAVVAAVFWPACVTPRIPWAREIGAQESDSLEIGAAIAAGGVNPEISRARSVSEMVYDGVFDIDLIGRRSKLDFAELRCGQYSMLHIDQHTMTREELLAEVERTNPEPRSWDVLGPIALCFDARPYEKGMPRDAVIVGKLKNYPGTDRGVRRLWVAYSDGRVGAANGEWKLETLAGDLDRSIAFYESIGIPMPEEMVRELREAMGVKEK